MAARANPLDGFRTSVTTNDFRVPEIPNLGQLIEQHGFSAGMKAHAQAMTQWSKELEATVNARLQPKDQAASLGSAAAPASTTPPTGGTTVSSGSGSTSPSAPSFPGYSTLLHAFADDNWNNALRDFISTILHGLGILTEGSYGGQTPPFTPAAMSIAVDDDTGTVWIFENGGWVKMQTAASQGPVYFYCADTGLWHQVSVVGDPSDWGIDGVGVQFPPQGVTHAYTSFQFPCADTRLWHEVSLVGTPPTWAINPTGAGPSDIDVDFGFALQPFWNADLEEWVYPKLVGSPPSWGF